MKTKVAIIGSGFGMYGLLPSFCKLENCEVTSICGKNSERMQNYCNRFNVVRYDNWKEMLEKEKPNAVAIAVIPEQQYHIAKYSLINGIAVFAEKPLTSSFETSKELHELAEKKKLPNMVDFIFPEIPIWKRTKKIIESNLIGKINLVKIEWNFLSFDIKNNLKSWKLASNKGGGALSFYFSHVFYYLEFFLGRIKNIDCKLTYLENDSTNIEKKINMDIVFKNGCICNAYMDISFTGKKKHSIHFSGENGSLILENSTNDFVDGFELIFRKSEQTNFFSEQSSNEDNDILEDSRVKYVTSIAEKFITWCNSGVNAKPNFQDGLRVQELIELARNSNNSQFLS